MDIDAEIKYDWKYGWDVENMSEPRPKVNLLLKAMLERNIDEMEDVFRQGATLQKADKATFERAVYHILDDYNVVKCMVRHGFVGYCGDFAHFKCYGPDAFPWDLMARAWYLKKYDILELLAAQGFEGLGYCINGEGEDVDRLMVIQGDVKGVKILLEYGYPREQFEYYQLRYPNSAVIHYLHDNPVVKRKIGVLDPWKYRTIPYPALVKLGLFNRKKGMQRNQELLLDYEDRVEAQKKFKERIGVANWNSIVKYNEELSRKINTAEILDGLLEDFEQTKGKT